ncbi:MAG: acyltransferase family protein [Verrucomicrobium sp.]
MTTRLTKSRTPIVDVAHARSGDAGMNLLFLLAMALVFNSHLEEYHVRPWLAGDGLLGNSMFFALSGYRISLSLSLQTTSFLSFLKRRLIRIYPTVWLVVLILGPTAGWLAPASTLSGIFSLFIWPTRFTYVSGIVPIYVLLYLMERLRPCVRTRFILLAATLALSVLTAFSSSANPLSLSAVNPWAYAFLFFSVALAGSILAQTSQWRRTTVRIAMFAGILVVSYLSLKLFSALSRDWSHFLPILLLGAISAVAIVAAVMPGRLTAPIDNVPVISRCSAFVARYSLEIYTVHCIVIEWTWLRKLQFPLGLIGALVVSVSLAAVSGLITHRLFPARTATKGGTP